jgi:hypothetical protein
MGVTDHQFCGDYMTLNLQNQMRRLPNAIGLGHPETTEESLNGFLLWIFSQGFGSKNGTSGCSEDDFDH